MAGETTLRAAAIDLGKVRVGLAVTDELGLMAHSRGFLDGKSRKALLAAFAEELRAAAGVPVDLWDERLSTVEASRRLRDRGVKSRAQRAIVDGAAAAVILQSWMDGQR